MRPPHRILNRRHVHRLAAEHLQAHLKFKDYKRKTSAQVLWSLLLAAAARITSLSDACQRLEDAPSDDLPQPLGEALPDLLRGAELAGGAEGVAGVQAQQGSAGPRHRRQRPAAATRGPGTRSCACSP